MTGRSAEGFRSSEASNAAWALGDQVVSSATNFGSAVLAARVLGVDAFGAFGVAFAVYLLALGVSRAVSVEPLLIRHAGASTLAQRRASGRAAGSSIGVALLASTACALFALSRSDAVGDALVALAVALPFLLVQDVWRFSLIMSKRARAAMLNDAVWLAGVLVAYGSVEIGSSDAGVATAAWASGAMVAALVGAHQVGVRPSMRIYAWWREHADLGPRYVGEFAATFGVTYALFLLVASLGGAEDLSGIRGAQVLFGPLNILFMGLLSLGVPIQVRRTRTDRKASLRLPMAVSVVCASSVLAWAVVLSLSPSSIGSELLGDSWASAQRVAPYMAWSMAASGITMGPLIALRAAADAKTSFRLRALAAPVSFSAGTVCALLYGPVGAIAAPAAVTTVMTPWWWRAARTVEDR